MKKSIAIVLHLGYWMMYLFLLILIIQIFSLSAQANENLPAQHLSHWLPFFLGFAIIPGMLGFYSFYTFLFSKFLNQKKILALFLYGALVSIICGLIGELILSLTFGGTGAARNGHIFPNYEPSEIIIVVTLIIFNALINGVVGLVMRGFITSYGDIKLKEDLNKKNYEMELALVKNQINPHFLFNTINNIDVLIAKDAAKASDYLNKLSDIMRFMLYETKTEKISLTKELTYIEKYIELQKIRTSNLNYVNYSVDGNADNFTIAPMLFIPFIENAFKHSENKKTDNAINIKVIIKNGQLTFDCENKYSKDAQTKLEQSGLGNDLIKKRLDLLYPGKHKLEVEDKNETYKVKLIIHE